MKYIQCIVCCTALILFAATCFAAQQPLPFFTADNSMIHYTGRIDFSSKQLAKCWMPGVYMTARFSGADCRVVVQDEMLWGNHNYITIVVDDGKPLRMQLTAKQNIIYAAKGLTGAAHTVTICKDTEAGIGFIAFAGIYCEALLPPPAKPLRRIEYYGNSITCGTGSDAFVVPCGKGLWHDQHNAYMSYGAVTARMLQAQWQLSAVSGIGLMHSCCNLGITMPQVYDKINMRSDSLVWNFDNYIPDVVTVCLGQNDGVQDSAVFCSRYIDFVQVLRGHYPKAAIICISSPMADAALAAVQKKYLGAIVSAADKNGDSRVYSYFFSKRYYNGCDTHPDLAEHGLIAAELGARIKEIMQW